ncbi:hypothetical protein MRX96_003064 [Rhipicephalus microplus]
MNFIVEVPRNEESEGVQNFMRHEDVTVDVLPGTGYSGSDGQDTFSVEGDTLQQPSALVSVSALRRCGDAGVRRVPGLANRSVGMPSRHVQTSGRPLKLGGRNLWLEVSFSGK